MAWFALAVVNGTLVIPFVGTLRGDVAARDGKIVQIADAIEPSDADVVVDADLTVLDPNLEAPVTVDRLLSAQDHTPFDGFPVKGWSTHTIRDGRLLFADGKVVGAPAGQFLKCPVALHDDAAASRGSRVGDRDDGPMS